MRQGSTIFTLWIHNSQEVLLRSPPHRAQPLSHLSIKQCCWHHRSSAKSACETAKNRLDGKFEKWHVQFILYRAISGFMAKHFIHGTVVKNIWTFDLVKHFLGKIVTTWKNKNCSLCKSCIMGSLKSCNCFRTPTTKDRKQNNTLLKLLKLSQQFIGCNKL